MPSERILTSQVLQGLTQYTPITTRVQDQAGFTKTTTLDEIAQQGNVTILTGQPPTASAPTEGLPTAPEEGRFYTFASRPDTIYVNGSDNVWRALQLVRVG